MDLLHDLELEVVDFRWAGYGLTFLFRHDTYTRDMVVCSRAAWESMPQLYGLGVFTFAFVNGLQVNWIPDAVCGSSLKPRSGMLYRSGGGTVSNKVRSIHREHVITTRVRLATECKC